MAISDILHEAVDRVRWLLSEGYAEGHEQVIVEALLVHMDRVRHLLDIAPSSEEGALDPTATEGQYGERLRALQEVARAIEPLRPMYEQDLATQNKVQADQDAHDARVYGAPV